MEYNVCISDKYQAKNKYVVNTLTFTFVSMEGAFEFCKMVLCNSDNYTVEITAFEKEES